MRGQKTQDNRIVLAIKNNSGMALKRRLFVIESQMIAEEQIERTRTGNPIADTITANKIWKDHLKRIGIKK